MKPYNCVSCKKRVILVDGDIYGDFPCPYCRSWNKIKDGKITKGAWGAYDEYREDINTFTCDHCRGFMIRYHNDILFKMQCGKCTVINEYPKGILAAAKKTRHNISRYLREQRRILKLPLKKSKFDN